MGNAFFSVFQGGFIAVFSIAHAANLFRKLFRKTWGGGTWGGTWGQTERSPGFSSQINMENVPSVPVFPDTLYHMFLLQEDRGIPHGKEPRDRPLVMLWRSGRPGLLRQRHILHWLYASVALCVRRGCRSR